MALSLKTAFVLLAAGTLLAGTGAARAQDTCGPPGQINSVQMTRLSSTVDLVPLTIAGVRKNFLFDTAGTYTAIRASVAQSLKLAIHQSAYRGIVDMMGQRSFQVATLPHFELGRMQRDNVTVMIATEMDGLAMEGADGIYALDLAGAADMDVDFGTDMLSFYAPDHCPGPPSDWKMPARAVLPLTLKDNRITVPVTLDGQDYNAIVDTGSENASLQISAADLQRLYGLTPGSDDTPEGRPVNGIIKAYHHNFKSLALGDVRIANPRLTIIPAPQGPATGSVIIGMNVLRKLHIYMAFKEGKMYISPASAPAAAPVSTTPASPP